MSRIAIGMDLCDAYTQIAVYNEDTGEVKGVDLNHMDEEDAKGEMGTEIPTSVCKCRRRDEWHAGQEAVEMGLVAEGYVMEKFIDMLTKGKKNTFEGHPYTGRDLLAIFIKGIFEQFKREYAEDEIVGVAVTLRRLDLPVMEVVKSAFMECGIPEDHINMLSHPESYMYYMLSQKREYFTNMSCMFDLSDEGLEYYEGKVMRGGIPHTVTITRQALEEGVNLGVFSREHGNQIADNVTADCAQRILDKKIISSVYLTGKGFLNVKNWGTKTLKILCARRHVFYEDGLFAKGAALMAFDRTREKSAYQYICVCEGRTTANVTMVVTAEGQKRNLVLSPAGQNWYDAQRTVEFYPSDVDNVEVIATGVSPNSRPTVVRIPLAEFPNRPDRTTRLRLKLRHMSENTCELELSDLGFGEIYPASDVVRVQNVIFDD